ncbi:MAG: hypothetical protein ACI38Q_01070 [Candidatus Bruticola sp.]
MINIKNFAYIFASGAFCFALGTAVTAEPAWAERPPAVKYEVTDLENRAEIKYYDRMRVNRILNNYFDKMAVVEKCDNDVRYLIMESNKLSFEELGKFLDKNVMPTSQALLFKANEVTSESSALRELHALYITYVTERHKALSALAVYSKEKAPETTVATSTTHNGMFGSSSSTYYANTKEHVPHTTYDNIASYRKKITDCDTLRNIYYNRKDYILRNSLEVIGEEK